MTRFVGVEVGVCVGVGAGVSVGVGVGVGEPTAGAGVLAHAQLAEQESLASMVHRSSQRVLQQYGSHAQTQPAHVASLQFAVALSVQQSPGVGVGGGGPWIETVNVPLSALMPSTTTTTD